ncbi:hypothetical protein AciX9_3917 (plasmid) [Granulicella tundricola MP5ACTX9]|uniref:Uncharacterized protein n=1 Tax=Granulicella tundricola (strain ATCC BAA-1859 / DSM 23138 / MP5ACTX9) TaxID=1198114 RepID=E8X6P3_GRATM|nr:hypothetical protein AciX9_3917 [Granulicella tundricola MP5ACTX9]
MPKHPLLSRRDPSFPRYTLFLPAPSPTAHQGIAAFSQRVNVPVGPSGPSSTTRTTSRDPSSTDSVPAYPLRFVFVNVLWLRRLMDFFGPKCGLGAALYSGDPRLRSCHGGSPGRPTVLRSKKQTTRP